MRKSGFDGQDMQPDTIDAHKMMAKNVSSYDYLLRLGAANLGLGVTPEEGPGWFLVTDGDE